MGVWDFIQDQVLGMKWLNELLGIGLSALGLDVNGRIGGSVQFFIYDVLKITVLLCVLIFAISYIQSYFPPERSKRILGRFHGIWANIISALLGTVTPFCSCSSIPLFIGFTSAGLPLGVTFSFLISSPMVDLGSLVLLMSIFGAKVAVVYVILGLVIAVIGGSMIEKLRMEKYVESFVLSAGSVDIESPDLTIRERLTYAKEQMLGTFKKVFPYPVTFLIMLFSSIMANSLATRVKEQARLAVEKSYYTELLLESSQKLQQSQTELDCLRMTAEQLSRLFDRPVLYALSRGDAELSFRAEPPEASPLLSQLGLEELGVAKWVQKNNRHAGATTHTLPDSKWLFLSVRGTRGVMGIVGVPIAGYRIPDAFEKNLMIAILSQCGLSQERIRLQDAHASAAPPS